MMTFTNDIYINIILYYDYIIINQYRPYTRNTNPLMIPRKQSRRSKQKKLFERKNLMF